MSRPAPKPLALVLIGLLGLAGLVWMIWPRPPALEQGAVAGDAGEATWELRHLEGKASLRGPTMGTSYSVVLAGEGLEAEPIAAALEAVDAELAAVNAEMSTYLEDSALSRFNAAGAGEPFAASAHLIAVVAAAKDISERSSGAFDVTVGPLVDAWGFGPDPRQRRELEADEIAALRARVGDEKLRVDVDAGVLEKSVAGLRVDLSAIAKGHGCDRVAAVLDGLGFERYMVEVGGEVRARGLNPEGEPWRIGIERPTADAEGARAVQAILPLRDACAATSGDYRNYWEVDGVRYSHTVDPRTGRPIEHSLASVTVVHPDSAALADGWATALNVLGPDEGLALAKSEGLAAYFLVREAEGFSVRQTSAFEALLP